MKRRPAGLLFLLAAFAPTDAHAHLVNSGLGPFYDGALHLILSPMDIVRLMTLALFAGAQGRESARYVVLAAPVAWFLAGASALIFDATGMPGIANAASLFLLGGAVAFELKLAPSVAAAAAAGFAALLGFQSGIELRSDGADWVALLGTAAVVLAIVLPIAALVVSATAFPVRVACRVLGSWASATGLLSIGWIIAANR
ncbi:HupE/UreJ family protein [Taklimakanibacter deserti]|uniref:HupE/UreJ family protein n=1 Tax=Taklimakanibacter deserti TaxID=2267839 RepID=UPI000E64BEAB